MWVRDVMTRDVVTARTTTSVKAALELLDRSGITSLPVVDAGNRLLGVVSEADLIAGELPADVRSTLSAPSRRADVSDRPATVGEAMTRHVLTVREDSDLAEAVALMADSAVKSLPVVDTAGRVVGVVSRRDVVHVLARPDEDVEAQVEALLCSLGTDWMVTVEEGVAVVEGPGDDHAVGLATTAALSVPGVVAVVVRSASTKG